MRYAAEFLDWLAAVLASVSAVLILAGLGSWPLALWLGPSGVTEPSILDWIGAAAVGVALYYSYVLVGAGVLIVALASTLGLVGWLFSWKAQP